MDRTYLVPSFDPFRYIEKDGVPKGTYLDTLPEELLIEISILIKEDPILYKLSEYTKKAYLKYLDSVFKGFINTFNYNNISFGPFTQDDKIYLTNDSGFPDIVSIDKLYDYIIEHQRYKSIYEYISEYSRKLFLCKN